MVLTKKVASGLTVPWCGPLLPGKEDVQHASHHTMSGEEDLQLAVVSDPQARCWRHVG